MNNRNDVWYTYALPFGQLMSVRRSVMGNGQIHEEIVLQSKPLQLYPDVPVGQNYPRHK